MESRGTQEHEQEKRFNASTGRAEGAEGEEKNEPKRKAMRLGAHQWLGNGRVARVQRYSFLGFEAPEGGVRLDEGDADVPSFVAAPNDRALRAAAAARNDKPHFTM
jgi:hypothetical protein